MNFEINISTVVLVVADILLQNIERPCLRLKPACLDASTIVLKMSSRRSQRRVIRRFHQLRGLSVLSGEGGLLGLGWSSSRWPSIPAPLGELEFESLGSSERKVDHMMPNFF